MSLVEKQQLFARLLGVLLVWVYAHPGWAMTLAEGYIGDSIDKPGEDTPHLRHGNHFKRLAQDVNLFVDGRLITDGGHPAWRQIGEFWEALHPLCAWGGRFRDANHVSLEHEGVR